MFDTLQIAEQVEASKQCKEALQETARLKKDLIQNAQPSFFQRWFSDSAADETKRLEQEFEWKEFLKEQNQ